MIFGKKKKRQVPEKSSAPKAIDQSDSIVAASGAQEPAAAIIPEKPAATKARRRPGPGKTRLMGFDTSDGRIVDLFDEKGAAKVQNGRCSFPVAWVLVTKGPGQGECFALQSGMSQIGRGEDQAVCLDFGDQAISRTNHAAIVYDPKSHEFLLGHGGKANIVRHNGSPVVTTQELADGDTIEIGETSMRFKSLCSQEFNWTDIQDEGEDDDVEIA